jgi:hypothetical protein
MNSDSAIFCFGEENVNSYKENKKRKDGAKIQFCAVFVLCAKTAQDYFLRKYTRFAWAGGTFFPVVSFWFWREIGFGFTYLRTLLNNFFGTNIFLIVVEILRYFMRQFR